MSNKTPVHFVLQLGSLLSLYLSVSFLLVLLFGLINLHFPDVAEGYYALDSASSSVRLGIAMVLVFAPTYFFLMRMVNKIRRQTPSNQYLSLTKWLIYLSLLIGLTALLIDLVVVIMTFLEGEITQRFLYKAFAVLLVIGTTVHYYILDARGHWLKNEGKSILYGIGAALVVLAAVGYGFANIETPAVVREAKIDTLMVSDLQDMQWRIEDYYRVNNALPENLETIYGSFPVPQAPENKPDYAYEVTGDKTYKLCATFSQAISRGNESVARPVFEKNADWNYKAGEWCFERSTEGLFKQ